MRIALNAKSVRIFAGALFGVLTSFSAYSQIDASSILRQMILQLQTGQPNPAWYGVQLWQTIAAQTSFTGIYPQLVQLGPVTNVTVTQQAALPTGMLYAATAQHQNGISTWVLGISSLTNRIEYANLTVGGIPQQLPPPQQPGSTVGGVPQQLPPPQQPGASPNPPSNPLPQDKTSPACQKYPNLC
jgi:hypothetical protein